MNLLMRNAIWGALILAAPSVSARPAGCGTAEGFAFVCDVHHPEDIEATPASRWIVASQTSFGHGDIGPGALVLIDTQTLTTRRIAGVEASATACSRYADCTSETSAVSHARLSPKRRGKRTRGRWAVS